MTEVLRETDPRTTVRFAETEDLAQVRRLFEEYAESLGIDLDFQGFNDECANLPGAYGLPHGCLLVVSDGKTLDGCVAVRKFTDGVCEMKRLYVRPEARGSGLGRRLAEAAVTFGKDAGYAAMRLDTLPSMATAQGLYRQMGFKDIPSYRHNPISGTSFMELMLRTE